MRKKKILLLGGSAQQVVAIKKAKELGYYTIICDYLPDNPGQYVADKYYDISTTDIDSVYQVAKSENVNGILAYASDPAALPAAIVCERLGLPTNPAKSVEILGLKYPWRRFLQENGFACPKAESFSPHILKNEFTQLIQGFSFPIVIKPTDSSGSKGVSVLNDLTTLHKAIEWADKYSRNKILIVEEFIHRGFPHVIGGDIFIIDNKIVLYGEMSCIRGNNGNSLIPIGERKPSGLNNKQIVNIHNELQKLIQNLNIKFGEFNIEILLDKEDNVHFLELGPRAGGNMIPIQLSDAFGVDLVKANILAAMGEKFNFTFKEKEGCFFTYVLHSMTDGIFKYIQYADEVKPYIYRKVIYKKEGDKVEVFDGAGKAIGILFFHTDSEEIMNDLCNRMESLVKIILYYE